MVTKILGGDEISFPMNNYIGTGALGGSNVAKSFKGKPRIFLARDTFAEGSTFWALTSS